MSYETKMLEECTNQPSGGMGLLGCSTVILYIYVAGSILLALIMKLFYYFFG